MTINSNIEVRIESKTVGGQPGVITEVHWRIHCKCKTTGAADNSVYGSTPLGRPPHSDKGFLDKQLVTKLQAMAWAADASGETDFWDKKITQAKGVLITKMEGDTEISRLLDE